MLADSFSTREIDDVVDSCNSQKALGPDGFNFSFIKESWNTIKEDFYTMVRNFWESSVLPKGFNVAWVALIPKIDIPAGLKDFRPISMVGCCYKIIAKLLARRLQKVMNSLIGQSQSSFVEDR